MLSAEFFIDTLQMQAHPEGGWFVETYRSPDRIRQAGLPDRYPGDRSVGTGIYFLLTSDNFSSLHRLRSDEGWHFYAGTGLEVIDIAPDGTLQIHRLGQDWAGGERFQAWVPAGHWFGSRVVQPQGYALVGCTVAPGFDFADFELARRDLLSQQFPQHRDLITALTRN